MLARRPEWRGRAVVVYSSGGRGGAAVVSCSKLAAAHGVRRGIPLAQARTRLEGIDPPAIWTPNAPLRNRLALQRIAEWCFRFSPWVAIEPSDVPESLFLDIAGCDHLFGGEKAMVEEAVRSLEAQHLYARAAVADTPGAAWAIARYVPSRTTVTPPARHAVVLQGLPIEALRLSSQTTKALHWLDIHTIGRLMSLPRQTLPSRFGPEVLCRLDQALGRASETLTPLPPPIPLHAQRCFAEPIGDGRILEQAVRAIIRDLLDQAQRQRKGLQAITYKILQEGGEIHTFDVRLLQPTTCLQRLYEMTSLRMERFRLSASVESIEADGEASAVELILPSLFEEGASTGRRSALQRWVERLSHRLGRDSVARPRWTHHPLPECAVTWVPAAEGGRSSVTAPQSLPPRPMRLLASPSSVAVMSVVPEGPPLRFCWKGRTYRVARSWGPERFETGWWRGRHVRRDYYRVETTCGRRFWLFRTPEGWFLHGIFA